MMTMKRLFMDKGEKMQNYIWNIDTEIIDYKDKMQYTITGWFVSKIKAPFEVSACLNVSKKELPVSVKWVPRDDVTSMYPFSRENMGPGFVIQLKDLKIDENDLDDVLMIEMIIQEEKICLIEKSLQEIKKNYQESILSYSLDKICEEDGQLVLSGWACSKENSIEYQIKNEKNVELEAVVERTSRIDISELYSKDPKEKLGFKILVDQDLIKENKIFIRISDGMNQTDINVDLLKFRMSQTFVGRMWNLFKPSKLRITANNIKEHGWEMIHYEITKGLHPGISDYEIWFKKHCPSKKELKLQREKVFSKNPKFSIVIPLYNTPIEYLKEIVDSVLHQTYGNFELCLADGSTNQDVEKCIKETYGFEKRILYKKLSQNCGISENTNEAIRMATGDYIMLTDHDDILTPNALYELAAVINEYLEVDIIYTDEDKVTMDGKHYFDPNFKPDFNIDYLRSTNYICHIFTVRKSLVDEVGLLKSEFDGSQDYDFILRCCEKTKAIYHIPKVLYHWRAHRGSTAGNPASKQYAIDAGKKALEMHYQRMGIRAQIKYTDIFIMFQTIPEIVGNPKISIIICSKDHISDLDKCIESIERKSTWNNYEIIVVENNSEDKNTFIYYEEIQKKYDNVKVVYWKDEFNYSAINNYGATFATGEYILLLNNDIEVITPEWMEYMLGYCQREDVGIVGAKLCYPDDTVQHCGAVIGMGGFAGHILTRYDKDVPGPYGRLKAIHDVSAVTAACMMIKRSVFDQVKGLDESFKVALNDMDFCLRVRETGKLIVINPWAELYHYESKSRGMENNPEKLARFKDEIMRFRNRWNSFLEQGDPYYNPNLTHKYTDCSIRFGREKYDLVD